MQSIFNKGAIKHVAFITPQTVRVDEAQLEAYTSAEAFIAAETGYFVDDDRLRIRTRSDVGKILITV